MNPDLLKPDSQNKGAVPALHAITAPLGNTKTESVYFFCTMATASFHRKDGKKLPALNHVIKVDSVEDIAYLDSEVQAGNPYIRRATVEEVEHAKLLEDPMGTVREAVKRDLMNNFSIEELEKLLAERRAAAAHDPAKKIAGTESKLNQMAKDVLRASGVQAGTVGGANSASVQGAAATSTSR